MAGSPNSSLYPFWGMGSLTKTDETEKQLVPTYSNLSNLEDLDRPPTVGAASLRSSKVSVHLPEGGREAAAPALGRPVGDEVGAGGVGGWLSFDRGGGGGGGVGGFKRFRQKGVFRFQNMEPRKHPYFWIINSPLGAFHSQGSFLQFLKRTQGEGICSQREGPTGRSHASHLALGLGGSLPSLLGLGSAFLYGVKYLAKICVVSLYLVSCVTQSCGHLVICGQSEGTPGRFVYFWRGPFFGRRVGGKSCNTPGNSFSPWYNKSSRG